VESGCFLRKDELTVLRLKAGILAEPALFGRECELEELLRCLNSSVEGSGTTIFVSGEAGSGKTRLTREFLNIANGKRIPILAGLCVSDAAIPYLPFVEAFNSYFRSFTEEDPISLEKPGPPCSLAGTTKMATRESGITAWLTGQRSAKRQGKLQAVSPQVWQDQVFDGVTKTLHEISTQQPIVLYIEDIHWADSASLALLHYVSRMTKDSERILILATFRSEELTARADAEDHPHPLAETLRSMKRGDLFTEIKLSNLNKTDINKIAKNMIGGNLQEEFADKLSKESRGNPLFVVETLRMLSERKSLIKENDEWRLAVDEIGIPSKVRDIIIRRLSLLKHEQRRVLDVASVIGEKFDVELLGTVLGLGSLEVLEILDAIAHSTSLVGVDGSCYRFDHARSRETLYEELSLPLKNGYHLRTAERLEAIGKGRDFPLADIAFHYAHAGKEEKAVEFSLAAGQDALARFSNTEAIKHFGYAVEKTKGTPANAETFRIAMEGLGDAYYANCKYRKATEVFESLAASETGEARLRAYRKAMDSVMFGQHADFRDRLVELERKAEPFAASNRLESARIRFLGATAFMMKDSAKQIKAFQEALRIFEEEYSIPDVARALVPIARTLRHYFMSTHTYGRGVSAFLRSIAMYEEIGDLRGLLDALFFAGESFQMYGVLIQEAKQQLARTVQLGEKVGNFDRLAGALLYLGAIAEGLGLFEDAVVQTQKASEYAALTDTNYLSNSIYLSLARQTAKLGNLKPAEEFFNKTTAALPSDPLRLEWAKAVLFSAKNNWKDADECFEKGIKMAETRRSTILEMSVREDYALFLNRQGRTKEAELQLEKRDKIRDATEEAFARATVEASLMTPRSVITDEEFEMRLDLVNVSKKKCSLVKAEDAAPQEFTVTTAPGVGCLQEGTIQFEGQSINPFQVVTVKLGLKAPKPGIFNLTPTVTYGDESGEIKTTELEPLTITVQSAQLKRDVLPGRISTGVEKLDNLLLGGIPEYNSVVLASPSTDERRLLVQRFLETGAKEEEAVFNITSEVTIAKRLTEKHPDFYQFICNPQADEIVQNAPNIFKLKGLENLTEIDIALTKAFRMLNPSTTTRRICIDIVSDVLLQHHAVNTRRWLSALLPTLKSKGFTVLAVVDPQMHPVEELQAVLGVFDGEIRVTEKETPEGIRQTLRVRKLFNQKYLEKEIHLSKESISI